MCDHKTVPAIWKAIAFSVAMVPFPTTCVTFSDLRWCFDESDFHKMVLVIDSVMKLAFTWRCLHCVVMFLFLVVAVVIGCTLVVMVHQFEYVRPEVDPNDMDSSSIAHPLGYRLFHWLDFCFPQLSLIVETSYSWFVGMDRFHGFIQIEHVNSLKDFPILHDGWYFRYRFGEGIKYKIWGIFCCIGRRICDPRKSSLWKSSKSVKENILRILDNIRLVEFHLRDDSQKRRSHNRIANSLASEAFVALCKFTSSWFIVMINYVFCGVYVFRMYQLLYLILH